MRNFLSPPVSCSNFNNIVNAQINAPGIYLILEAQAREFNTVEPRYFKVPREMVKSLK